MMRDRGERGEKSCNLLQEAETVGDLIDVEVSILPRVNVDTLLSALKQPQHNAHGFYCVSSSDPFISKVSLSRVSLYIKRGRTLSYLERISARSSAINVSMSFFMSKSRREQK